MDSNQQAEYKTVHPTLGPGVAILDDRRRTRLRCLLFLCLLPLGVMGVLLGRQDNANGGTLLGLAEVFVSIFLAFYGLQGALVDARRMANPVRLLIARDGFEVCPGSQRAWWLDRFPTRHPILWTDVASVGDTESPDSPHVLRVQLRDPEAFAEANHLSTLTRIRLLGTHGDLPIASGLARTAADLEQMMRTRLAESRGPSGNAAVGLAPAPALPRRRPAAKR